MNVKEIQVNEAEVISEYDKFLSEPIVSNIIKVIRDHKDYTVEELGVKSRKRPVTVARQLNMYFLERHTDFSQAFIGKLFNRDHSTVIHAKKAISNLIDTNKRMRNLCRQIECDIDMYKNKKTTTRYFIFQQLLEQFIPEEDSEIKEEWTNRYINAL